MTASAKPERRRRSLGRRIATGIYFAFVAYIVAVGFYSIVPQVFWPRSSSPVASLPEGSCTAEIERLEAKLLDEASKHILTRETAGGNPIRAWLLRWDDRYIAVGKRCHGDDARTHELLGRLRHRVEDSLVRHDRLHAPLLREIDHRLANAGQKQQE